MIAPQSVKRRLRRLLERWTASPGGRRETPAPLAGLEDLSDEDRVVVESVAPFTMTGPYRVLALIEAVKYITSNALPGAIVECGVWRGGSVMAALYTLQRLKRSDRDVYLFDTFEGMTAPSSNDITYNGVQASDLLRITPAGEGIWCEAGLADVQANVLATKYPAEAIHFIKGDVCSTLLAAAPSQIAILRLDTDWYESTKHELQCLYPRLVPGGILIIDDYGHWQGARKAVDEYLATLAQRPYLHRIDYTGRLCVKPAL